MLGVGGRNDLSKTIPNLDVKANNTNGSNTAFEAYPLNLSTMNDVLRTPRISTKSSPYRACHYVYNEMLATMLGNFQDGSVAGKMQLGSGWWFLDQKDGMERQIEALSQLGSLSRFVGMLTDSRSFLSYTRHEYFRRILCNILGRDMVEGAVPYDFELVGRMVGNICYNNAADYFGFDVK